MKISIRKKLTKRGYHWYLDFNTKHDRYEFLDLFSFDEKVLGRKLTKEEKEMNEETKIKVDTIWRMRVEQQQEGTLKFYGIHSRHPVLSLSSSRASVTGKTAWTVLRGHVAEGVEGVSYTNI